MSKSPTCFFASRWSVILAGAAIGFFAQRTHVYAIGSIRDVLLTAYTHLTSGLAALIAAAALMNILV